MYPYCRECQMPTNIELTYKLPKDRNGHKKSDTKAKMLKEKIKRNR